jgi:hypothetical protein
VNIGADRERSFFVGGVDDPEQRVGGIGGDWEQADVVDLCRRRHSWT